MAHVTTAGRFRLTLLARLPPVYFVENLLSDAECGEAIALFNASMRESRTIRPVPAYRTSHSAHLNSSLEKPAGIRRVLRRMAALLGRMPAAVRAASFPVAEPVVPTELERDWLQFGRYTAGQYYRMHQDWHPARHYDRVLTFLAYLSDAVGGETVFPYLTRAPNATAALFSYSGMGSVFAEGAACGVADDCVGAAEAEVRAAGMHYCCCGEALRVPPRCGTATIFFPGTRLAKFAATAHAACPVRGGVKYVAQQWYHATPRPVIHPADAPVPRGAALLRDDLDEFVP